MEIFGRSSQRIRLHSLHVSVEFSQRSPRLMLMLKVAWNPTHQHHSHDARLPKVEFVFITFKHNAIKQLAWDATTNICSTIVVACSKNTAGARWSRSVPWRHDQSFRNKLRYWPRLCRVILQQLVQQPGSAHRKPNAEEAQHWSEDPSDAW